MRQSRVRAGFHTGEATMTKNVISALDAVFEHRRFFEYYLQRLRIIAAADIPLFKVTAMCDLPETADPDGFPSIEIKLRMPGIWFDNPVSGKSMLSRRRIQECFDGPVMQAAFRKEFANFIANSIPGNSAEYRLREKFSRLDEGRSGKLPPTADLKVWYDTVKRHVRAIKAYLHKNSSGNRMELSQQDPQFVAEGRQLFWWNLVERGDIRLEMIATNTPSSTALLVLMLIYGVEDETLRSRLYRR
jgi:hypothetical protein